MVEIAFWRDRAHMSGFTGVVEIGPGVVEIVFCVAGATFAAYAGRSKSWSGGREGTGGTGCAKQVF